MASASGNARLASSEALAPNGESARRSNVPASSSSRKPAGGATSAARSNGVNASPTAANSKYALGVGKRLLETSCASS
jgi:hypothetical protein